MILSLSLGFLLLAMLLFLGKKFAPDKYIAIISAVIAVLFLARFGMPMLAAIFGGAVTIAAYSQKILRFISALALFKNFVNRAQTNNSGHTTSAHKSKMTKKEAREVLGISVNATQKEIKSAYQHLMKKNHPDTGGSKYLAAKLNEAKDVLLK